MYVADTSQLLASMELDLDTPNTLPDVWDALIYQTNFDELDPDGQID